MVLLKNNIIIPEVEQESPQYKVESGFQLQASQSLAGTVPGLGVVYVVNATPNPISSVSVGNTDLSTVPAGSSPGQPPQSVSVNRFGSPPVFNGVTHFTVTFFGGRSYTVPIQINNAPIDSLTIWCFYNGLLLTGPSGSMKQIAWGI